MNDKFKGSHLRKNLGLSLALSLTIVSASRANTSETPIEPAPPEIPDVELVEANQNVGQCWFHPLKEDKGIKCKATFTVCQPGHPHCDPYLWVWCQNKLVFKGISYPQRASYSVYQIYGLPIGHYATPPYITLYLTHDSTPAAIYSILTYDDKNRSGSCSWPEGPLPQ